MFTHYLKIAFRNMWKYKNQTLISVIGLAVGFTCFALATLWIRYEMTFDSFHKNAKQMYVVYEPSLYNQTGYSRMMTHYRLAAYLKGTFPEIVNASSLIPSFTWSAVSVEGVQYPALSIRVDSSFFRMFDVNILVGSMDFLVPDSRKLAITWEKAQQLFGNEHPIGKTVNIWGDEHTICAIVSGMSKQSNYPFDIIQPLYLTTDPTTVSHGENTIIELFHGTNVEAFEKKLYKHVAGNNIGTGNMKIKPLTKLHYIDSDVERNVKFQHILIFALSGLLVILCSLFNYLTLFISRFMMRQKEMALRVVCGASGGSLMLMLTVEFMLTLLFAVVLGCCLTQIVHQPFLTLSDIQMNLSVIYRESFMYIGSIIIVSLLSFWLILFIFQRRTLNVSIRRSNKKLFRKVSVVAQLLISIGFAFCTIVILKQMYFLHHTDELGFSFKNSGSLMIYGENSDVFANQLKQIPEITDVVHARGQSALLPQSDRRSLDINSWDDKPADVENISLEQMFVSPEYTAFYDFRLVAGEILTDADPESMVLLNESAVKAFGWHEPVGKHFEKNYTVKGVIKNVYNFAPTVAAKPVIYFKPYPYWETFVRYLSDGTKLNGRIILFKYHEGTWKSCMEKIEQMKNEYVIEKIYNSEKEYDKYLKSETALIRLMTFVSAICILVSVFGFVSLVSLTCEERRKEIAIRKINGATAGDILAIFAKEYFLLLFIGAAIAFPAGFLIMKRWLEQYVKQTSIPAWIYLTIILVLALIIVLCVGWRVYRSSIENPAEVVKSE